MREGSRRFRALELLVKQKRLAKTAPVLAWCARAEAPSKTRWPKTSIEWRSTARPVPRLPGPAAKPRDPDRIHFSVLLLGRYSPRLIREGIACWLFFDQNNPLSFKFDIEKKGSG